MVPNSEILCDKWQNFQHVLCAVPISSRNRFFPHTFQPVLQCRPYSLIKIYMCLTDWSRLMHICVGKLVIIVHILVIAWSAPSHHLNQCWNIVNLTLNNKLQWNFKQNSHIFIQENAFVNVVLETVAILSRPECVTDSLEQFCILWQVMLFNALSCTCLFSTIIGVTIL